MSVAFPGHSREQAESQRERAQTGVSANPEHLITENLDIWTAAIQNKASTGRGSNKKQELYGIKKLRELILELAVRGLLVPQDPNDEPASVLLEKIAAEKELMVKNKRIRKPKKFSTIGDEEKHFKLPIGWSWTRLSEIGHDWGQKKPDDTFTYIDVGSINKELGFIDEPAVLEAGEAPSRARKLVRSGSVLYSTVRPYLLNIAVVDREISPEPIASTAFAILHPFKGVSASFLYRYLRSPSFVSYVESCQTGVAYPAINDKQFFSGVVPLPPEAEQPRIVAKVDELMALCDKLEQETEASLNAHQTLVETLLKALLAAAQTRDDASAFEQAWQRIAENFDILFTTEQSIDLLKQTILQLAVMGKLVPQDPNDEPASVLLEKIATEKERLVKEGKIKKAKPLISFSGLDEMKFELPENWEWIRLSDIADIVRGGSPRPAGDPRFYDGKIPFLKVADVTNNSGKFVEGYSATIKEAGLKKTRYIDSKTVLLSNSGATLGVPAICDFPATFNDGIAAFSEKTSTVLDEYLYLYLKTLTVWFLDVASRGQGQPNLNTDIIKATWFPLPPVNEQAQIVSKSDSLSLICDSLKTNIRESKTTQLFLSDSMSRSIFGRTVSLDGKENIETKEMKILTQLSLGEVTYDDSAILAPLIGEDGLDAKAVWSKSKLQLPEFYRQLKKEVDAGFICKPAKAEFEA